MTATSDIGVQYDSINAVDLPAETEAFAAYLDDYNYNDYAACCARFPNALNKSVTGNPIILANILDIESGNATIPQALTWWNLYKDKGAEGFYIQASSVPTLIAYLWDRGNILRSAYKIESAHWIYAHICAPSVCGYPSVEATQWTSGLLYDTAWYKKGLWYPEQEELVFTEELFLDIDSTGHPTQPNTLVDPAGDIYWTVDIPKGAHELVGVQKFAKRYGVAPVGTDPALYYDVYAGSDADEGTSVIIVHGAKPTTRIHVRATWR